MHCGGGGLMALSPLQPGATTGRRRPSPGIVPGLPGESLGRIGRRTSSRPVSCDPLDPVSPGMLHSPARRSSSRSRQQRSHQQYRPEVDVTPAVSRESRRSVQRPFSEQSSPGLGATMADDSLSELLASLQRPSRPSSYGSQGGSANGQGSAALRPASGSAPPMAVLQAALLPTSGPPSRGGVGRPHSRDDFGASCAPRPPRAPTLPPVGSGSTVPPTNSGGSSSSTSSPSAGPAAQTQRSRPPSGPADRPALSGTSKAGEESPWKGWDSSSMTPEAEKAAAPAPWGPRRSGKTAAFFSLASDANSEFRPYMEDGHKVVDQLHRHGSKDSEELWGLFAVYDGHGGRSEVDYVEAKLHDMLVAELQSKAPGTGCRNPQGALSTTFKKIDGQLGMLGAWNSGCTATVALVHQQASRRTVHVANVGDSRAVLVSLCGSSRRVSTDHRACDPAEAERVVRDGGIVRHGRVGGQLSVSRSLGDHHLKGSGVSCVPDVCSFSIAGEAKALVIASDGLWDALSDEDAGEAIRACVQSARQNAAGSEQALADWLRENAARTLVQSAKERGSRDNILALVVFF
eukprot:TRINITY_DN63297_c0_g1_i1.p1 TRINITY_DN63297_c0_g1~~TRINITY_DN63297_c0_g1_i1.p1  ORF type:complete len:587 (+),score=98.48 TRINITY_DN63297_c0_g1_i1:41-1762(+)